MGVQVQFTDVRRRARVLHLADEPVIVGGRHAAIRVPGATNGGRLELTFYSD